MSNFDQREQKVDTQYNIYVEQKQSRSNRRTRNNSKNTSRKNKSSKKKIGKFEQILYQIDELHIPQNTFLIFRLGIFIFFGANFGWFLGENIAINSYVYSNTDYYTFILVGATFFGTIGFLIGLYFSSKRRKARITPWWMHVLGISFMGVLSQTSLSETFTGSFWIGGVGGWLIVWFVFWGHREIT